MRFQNIFTLCVATPLILLGGCSLFDNSTKKEEANVAYFIAPEIASNGATPRKKPTQPKWEEEHVPEEDFSQSQEPQKMPDSIYVVQRGDTLYGVSRKLGIPLSTLAALNGLDRDSKLKAGQKLNVDGPSVPIAAQGLEKKMIVYEVQAGDSLSKIAKAYGISVKALEDVNVLQSDILRIGQKLNIPVDARALRKLGMSSSGERRMLDAEGRYTVKEGDSLSLIAKYFGVRRAALQDANGIDDPHKLSIGQKLIIPEKSTAAPSAEGQKHSVAYSQGGKINGEDLYTIKSGDTVGRIAKELGVEERDLVELNNLDRTSSLQAGKKLLIPRKKIANDQKIRGSEDFFDSFDEIPVVEVNNN